MPTRGGRGQALTKNSAFCSLLFMRMGSSAQAYAKIKRLQMKSTHTHTRHPTLPTHTHISQSCNQFSTCRLQLLSLPTIYLQGLCNFQLKMC